MTDGFTPAEAFPPGEYLRDELKARGWTQSQFAAILGRPLQLVNEIIMGRKRITEQTALEIGAALGTSAKVWLNLENTYRLWKAGSPDPAIARRAKQAFAA
jgi:HTH-type transcriptional regulator/antitoxin HigA